MYFSPFVLRTDTGDPVPVDIHIAEETDLLATQCDPVWQTDWTSDYLSAPSIEKYAVKTADQELIALAAYQVRGHSAYVYILYVESAPIATRP